MSAFRMGLYHTHLCEIGVAASESDGAAGPRRFVMPGATLGFPCENRGMVGIDGAF